MFDFVRKDFLFSAWDRGLQSRISKDSSFHLKTAQDLAAFSYLHQMTGKKIAEVGGGASRLLPALAPKNECWNIEKFEGADGGPTHEIRIESVKNALAFLGEWSPALPRDYFDVVFSVSVVEHVPTPKLSDFIEEGLALLKRGGLWLHAIDMYVTDDVTPFAQERFDAYRGWAHHPKLQTEGPVYAGLAKFSCDMVSNPDNTMYQWGKISPTMVDIRKVSQSVSILLAARKK